jgi:membrane complex biogenesis BtpA family protein
MSNRKHPPWSPVAKPVIGMLHAPPLPGSPRYGGDRESVMRAVLADAETLVDAGFHALMLENFGDAPFYPRRVPAETVAAMTRLAAEVVRRFDVPLGINVLRNDGESALAIAAAVGASFIRVNVLCGARVTDQGVIEGIAHDLLRLRRRLGADSVQVLADVDVKHSAPLAARPIAEEVEETIGRGGADAIFVSGAATGKPVNRDQLDAARIAAGETLLFVGSGVTADSLPELWPYADGFIVGTGLKQDSVTTNPVDPDRALTLMAAYRACE